MNKAVNTVEVIGAGAVGAFYASKLYNLDDQSVALIAAGNRYERLQREGLTVNESHYPFRVIHFDEQVPAPDLIIVAVKYHQLEEAIRNIRGRVGEHTQILSAMNGIDSEEMIGAVYGMERVLYGSAVGTFSTRDGKHITIMQEGRLCFGKAKNDSLSDRVKSVQVLFDRAGIVCEIPKDMIRTIWWKFMINVGVNQISGVVRAANAVLQNSEEAKALMGSAMREVLTLGRAVGADLREKDVEDFYPFLAGLSPKGKTSMLQDIEAARKTEVEMFAGKIVELGEKYGIPTPVNETLFRIIKAMESAYGA